MFAGPPRIDSCALFGRSSFYFRSHTRRHFRCSTLSPMSQFSSLSLIALVALCGCSSPGVENGELSGNTRTIGSADDGIELEQERIRFGDNDLAIYQVTLRNTHSARHTFEYRARWFDAEGMEVDDATRSWRPLVLDGGSFTPVRSVAPSMKALRCEIEVREHRPMKP